MPKFHSLRPFQPSQIDNELREPLPAFYTDVIDSSRNTFNQDPGSPRAIITQALSGKHEQHFQAEPINPMYPVQPDQSSITSARKQMIHSRYTAPEGNADKALQPLKSTRTVQHYQPQSLVTALQLTMEPKTNRAPIVIPAMMKKTKQLPVTQVLSPVTRRKISRFKLGIALGAMIAFTFLTAFSLGPVSQGKDTFPLVDRAIHWAQGQQQGWNSAVSHTVAVPATQNTTQSVVAAPAMPTIPQNNLVTLAQNDAIMYGISPYYFVRQIYAESGFNVNAYSPAGAVGIAQFLPSTAAGLGINPYDPVSALNGAAKFMAGLSNQFGGDYAKALAAYNAGSGAVQNAVNSAGANWLYVLPVETQLYVQKIMG